MTPIPRRLVLALGALLVVLAGLDLFVEHHPAFGIDGTPAFAAWYGILSAGLAILVAAAYARLARRDETAADREGADG